VITIKYPPDAFDPCERVGILNPHSSIEVDSVTGIERRRPANPSLWTYGERVKPQNVERQLDASVVCQLAMANLLQSITMHRHNLDALLNGDLQTSAFKFSRVAIGWPRREENLKPLPMAVVIPNGETRYAMPNLEANFIERTENAYAPETVLRQVSHATQELMVHILSAHHEERRAIRAAFELALLAEPNDDLTGRRQVVPEYYNRTCRIELLGMSDLDDADRALANEYELVARFRAEVAVVQLVSTPGTMQSPLAHVVAGTALISG